MATLLRCIDRLPWTSPGYTRHIAAGIGSGGMLLKCRYLAPPCWSTVRHYAIRPMPTSPDQCKTSIAVEQKQRTWTGWHSMRLHSAPTENALPSAAVAVDTRRSPSSARNATLRWLALSREALQVAFLPRHYPDSVTPEYLRFSWWQFGHNVAGSVCGVLSLQCLLYAVGLGAGAIPMAAALNWIIKDGLGQLGGVMYAGVMGSRFDAEPKRHRVRAAFLLQLTGALEIACPLWPEGFLLIASLSSIGKNVGWLATSATRAQINQTFASHENLGDITAKSGSQSTAAGLVGTGLGVLASSLTGGEFVTTALLYAVCSAINLYSCYRSVSVVRTRTLNVTRFELAVWPALQQQQTMVTALLDPPGVAVHEPILRHHMSPFHTHLQVDQSIAEWQRARASIDREQDSTTTAAAAATAFAQLCFARPERYHLDVTPHTVWLWYEREAGARDILGGIYHATLLRRALDASGESTISDLDKQQLVHDTHKIVLETGDQLVEQLHQLGWDTEHLFIGNVDQRLSLTCTPQLQHVDSHLPSATSNQS